MEENNYLETDLKKALMQISSLEKRLSFYRSRSSANMIDNGTAPAIMAYSGLKMLKQNKDCHSLLKKYLTETILDSLIELETKTFSSTLLDCMQSGILVHSSTIGLFAADSDCYDVFAPVFDPIIRECHPGLSNDFIHPILDWGDASKLCYSDEMLLYVENSLISCNRSLESLPFFPKMEEKHYIYAIEAIRTVLENNCGKYQPGLFYALEALDEETKARLKAEGLVFDKGDEAKQAAGSSRHWPTGRAVYFSQDRSFVTYVNYKNHIQFGCVRKDGDLKKMYEQMVNYGRIFDEHLPCVRHSKYGWLTASPSLLGNSLEIRARIRLVKLPTKKEKFHEILQKSNLKLAEQVATPSYVICELKNTRCLGLTEFDAMQAFSAGIEKVIRAEKEM